MARAPGRSYRLWLKYVFPCAALVLLAMKMRQWPHDNGSPAQGWVAPIQLEPARCPPEASWFELTVDSCDAISTLNFDDIYRKAHWGPRLGAPGDFYGEARYPPPKRKSSSGHGSDLGDATVNSLAVLKKAILEHNVTSMIDVPCGDVNWIFDSFVTDSLPLYLGLDISALVVQSNRLRFPHHRNKIFRQWDAVSCPLPKYVTRSCHHHIDAPMRQHSFQLVHARDVLQHLPLTDGLRYLCHIFTSGAHLLVTTVFIHATSNSNITSPGQFYHNNYFLPPFDFPPEEKTLACQIKSHSGTFPEEDYTCVFDLKKPWVKDWTSTHC